MAQKIIQTTKMHHVTYITLVVSILTELKRHINGQ